MLVARAVPPTDGGAHLFDARASSDRVVRSADAEHLLVDCGGRSFRLDIVSGTTADGPVSLCFELADDGRLDAKLEALAAFRASNAKRLPNRHLAGRLLALHAADARRAGASLRESADLLFGLGDWPGEGEYRKSRVRRLMQIGAAMIERGPAAILQEK